MTMNKTKGFLAAALTSVALATPAAAQDNDVFDCVLDELDNRIENLTYLFGNLLTYQTAYGSSLFKMDNIMDDTDVTYSHQQKMEIIAECEQSTGHKSNGIAEGLTKYSNGDPVVLFFKPR